MFGNNPKRPPAKGDGSTLEVQGIFRTFQGEGPFVGWPAIFVRLGGCNLACDFCDTEFESYHPMSCDAILETAQTLAGAMPQPLMVITGGEPLRQPIQKLCEAALARGFAVQVETNGTLFRPLPKAVDMVCSPKNTGQGYHPVREDLLPHISAFKFIISATKEGYQLPAEMEENARKIPVYLQPMDEYDPVKNRENMAYTVSLAEQYGYRISLQTHKILGIE